MTAERLTLRERQKMQTRNHLLDCAGELIATKGFASTSIDDIIDRAGVSRATLYAHFSGKDALLRAIVERMWADGLEFYEEFGALEEWSRSSILAWLHRFAAAWQKDSARNKAAAIAVPAVFFEAPDKHTQMANAVRRNSKLWEHFTEIEASMRSAMVVNLVESQLSDYFFNSSSMDLPTFVGYLTDALHLLLQKAR